MKNQSSSKLAPAFLVLLIVFIWPVYGGRGEVRAGIPPRVSAGGITLTSDRFYRTELYFGFSKPDGSEITADEWARFLADEVTPRFPAGFTVVEALGQYQGDDKKIVKEKSRMLVLLYPKKDRKANNPKIEAIREAYKKTFQQESVMRLDIRQTVDVSF